MTPPQPSPPRGGGNTNCLVIREGDSPSFICEKNRDNYETAVDLDDDTASAWEDGGR